MPMPLSVISIRRWTRPSAYRVSLAQKRIVPPSGVYLTALERMLISTCPVSYTHLLGGMILVVLGIIGEYVGRIYMCANAAPQYVERAVIRHED